MIEVIQWPPVHYCTYSLLGRRFEQEPDEPFVIYMKDGSVDTDLARQTKGFVNRIQRFGIQNKIDPKAWDTESIFYSILPKLPLELRGKFFRTGQSDSPHTLMSAQPHHAPVPTGLAEAAGFRGVADNDPDLPVRLAALTPDKWLAVLKKWLAADPAGRKGKTVAGPPWWFALHSVALNPVATSTPANFVGVWLGTFPCRKCRVSARAYVGSHPAPDWSRFAQWATDFHSYVTSKK